MSRFVSTVGKQFGKLFVLKDLPGRILLCRCKCGTIKTYSKPNVVHGRSTCCGCNVIHHGLSKHPLYKVWHSMNRRCYSKKDPGYKDYGGRGIRVCKKWKSDPKSFYEWAKKYYKPGLVIDRIDNDGNYEPSNCRFITNKKSNSNRRDTLYYLYNGKRQSLSDLVDNYGVASYQTVYRRLKRGYSIDMALKTKVKSNVN